MKVWNIWNVLLNSICFTAEGLILDTSGIYPQKMLIGNEAFERRDKIHSTYYFMLYLKSRKLLECIKILAVRVLELIYQNIKSQPLAPHIALVGVKV